RPGRPGAAGRRPAADGLRAPTRRRRTARTRPGVRRSGTDWAKGGLPPTAPDRPDLVGVPGFVLEEVVDGPGRRHGVVLALRLAQAVPVVQVHVGEALEDAAAHRPQAFEVRLQALTLDVHERPVGLAVVLVREERDELRRERLAVDVEVAPPHLDAGDVREQRADRVVAADGSAPVELVLLDAPQGPDQPAPGLLHRPEPDPHLALRYVERLHRVHMRTVAHPVPLFRALARPNGRVAECSAAEARA